MANDRQAKNTALKTWAEAQRPPVGPPAYVRHSVRRLMLAYWGRHGALPQWTLELAGACVRAGQDSQTTFSVSSSNELFAAYGKFGEALFPVDTFTHFSSALNISSVLSLRRRLRARLAADGTQAFVSLMSHVWSPFVTSILRKEGVRHIVIVHDADPHVGDRTALINRWLLQEAKSADQVVTLTNFVAERLVERNIVPERKISVMFHPDLTYGPINTNSRSDTEPVRVALFGRMLPYKGISLFVRAMKILKETGLSVHVGVFGPGRISQEDERRLARLDAEVINRWLDPALTLEILAQIDVLVACHTEASQSGVIAAAYGAGIPVVATPVGGLPEQVVSGMTGLVAADITAEAIAAAVRRLAEDRNLLLKIRQGIVTTRQDRSIERFFNELSEIALKGS